MPCLIRSQTSASSSFPRSCSAWHSVSSSRTSLSSSLLARAESLKWIGLLCMVLDHAGKFLALSFVLSHPLGRCTFPLFAVAAAVQLCRPQPNWRALRRVLVAAVVCFPFFYVVTRETIGPVLVTLSAGALLFSACCLPPPATLLGYLSSRRSAAVVGASALALLGEYSLFGALYLAGVARLLRGDRSAGAVAWFVVGSLGQLWTEGAFQFAACVLAPVLLFVVPALPRVRHFFLSFYVLQWPALLVLR